MKIYPTSITREFNGQPPKIRKKIIQDISNKQNPTWDDFVKLEAQLANEPDQFSVRGLIEGLTLCEYDFKKEISEAMLKIIEKITPRQLAYPYSKSNLMEVARFDLPTYINSESGGSWISPSIDNINAAKVIRTIITKIGNDLPDESDILIQMLESKHSALRLEGYRAIHGTSKHRWRYDQRVLDVAVESMLSESQRKKEVAKGLHVGGHVADEKKLIPLDILAADPSYLFYIIQETGEMPFYWGADSRVENVLIECVQENDKNIREKAFVSIGLYLEKHNFEHPLLANLLIKGLERGDAYAIYATAQKINHASIRDSKLIPLLIKYGGNPVWQYRENAIFSLYKCVEREKINLPEIKLLARKCFNDENNMVRAHATNLFCILLSQEAKPNLDDSDINSLISIGSFDSEELSRSNATYALSIVITKDLDRISNSDRSIVHGLCVKFKDYEGASKEERVIMSQAAELLNSIADKRREKVISNIANSALAEEVGQLFDLDRIIINELDQKVTNLKQSLTTAKEKIEQLSKKTLLQEKDLRDKEQLIKELKSKLKDSVEQLKRFKSSGAKKQGARMILTALGLFAPQLKLLELSTDVIQSIDSISNIVDIVDIMQEIPSFVSKV